MPFSDTAHYVIIISTPYSTCFTSCESSVPRILQFQLYTLPDNE